jgi:outer membrane protein assembly factor BamB
MPIFNREKSPRKSPHSPPAAEALRGWRPLLPLAMASLLGLLIPGQSPAQEPGVGGGQAAVPVSQPAPVDDQLDLPETDWPWWRGPLRNGTANPKQHPPTEFDETKNLRWRVEIPGRGFGSPTVVGDRVFIATSDETTGSQSVIAWDRGTGKRLWQTVVHASGGMRKNAKSTAASSTPASDGKRLFINFPNSDALYTTALDLDGKQLWQVKISDYVIHQGYGASPALYRDLVITSADNKGGGAIAALQRDSGEMVWRRERPALPNYPSPILLRVGGVDQVVMVGCDQVVSYHPLTGETLWETAGATTECVTSTLTDGRHVFTSGGYPANHMSAIKADGSAEKVWQNDNRLYVPSLVIREGYLYGVLDAGIAMCWKSDTGAEQWKQRLGGTFSSSPVLVGDQIFVTNEEGDFFVYKADPERFQSVAKNKVGDLVLATPAICDSQIFHRVTDIDDSGNAQEFLYCFGAEQSADK